MPCCRTPKNDTSSLQYAGGTLSCSGIVKGDPIDTALSKLDARICSLSGNTAIFALKTTTVNGHALSSNVVLQPGDILKGDGTKVVLSDGTFTTFTADTSSLLSITAAANTYAPVTHTHSFSSLTSKPISIAGYGITDVYTKTQADAQYKPITYLPSWSEVSSRPTTLSGYGITDAYPSTGNPSGFLTSGSLTPYETTSHASSTYATLASLSATNTNVSANTSAIAGKQATLVSGTSIKTINGSSLLGSGDISITGSGGSTPVNDNLTTTTTGNALDAHQGYVLKGLVDANTASISTNTSNISSNTTAISAKLTAASNLSDIVSPSTARTNLGLGTIATKNSLLTGDIPDISATYATQSQLTTTNTNVSNRLIASSNLSDLSNTGTARTNLGLGSVENTALSTWAGSTSITTAGTITTGTWNGTAISVTSGGNGLTTATLGDLRYGSGTNTLAALAGNTTTTQKFLTQTGNSTLSAAPQWTDLFGTANSWGANQTINGKVGIGSTTTPAALLHLSATTQSNAANFSTSGFGIRQDAATYTSTTSSGTVTIMGVNTFGVPTLAASSTTTLSTAATVYIGGAPNAGANVTITTGYSLYIPFGNVYIANNLQSNRLTMGLSSFSTATIATTAGSLLSMGSITITDTATAASGVVTHGAVNSIAQSTITATNTAITYTNASTLFINNAPTAGTNVTITNPWALYINAGNVLFNDNLTVNGVLTLSKTLTTISGTTSVAPVNIPSGTNRTSPVSGDVENNGSALQYTNSSNVRNVIALVKNTAELSYTAGTTGTIVWDGTAPSGTETHKYRWQQVGILATIIGVLKYTTAGATNTTVTIDLPPDCPTPIAVTGFSAATEIDYIGSGALSTSTILSNTSNNACYLQLNSTGTGWQIVVKSASIAAKIARFTIVYNTTSL